MSRLGLHLTPHGHLQFGVGEMEQVLPPVLAWWHRFAARYMTALCLHAAATREDDAAPPALPAIAAPGAVEPATLVLTVPMMPGAEHVTLDTLLALWTELGAALYIGLAAAGTNLQGVLKALNLAWNLVDVVYVHAPNRLARSHAHQAVLVRSSRIPGSRRCSSTIRSGRRRKVAWSLHRQHTKK